MIATSAKSKSAPKPTGEPNAAPVKGIIRAGESYTLTVFLKISGLREWGWRQVKRSAKAAGITLDRKVGSTSWVRGDDWLAFLETLGSRNGDTER